MGKQVVWNDKRIVGSPVVHMGCLAVVLFAFWMALSGHTETKFIVNGVITALVGAPIFAVLLRRHYSEGRKA